MRQRQRWCQIDNLPRLLPCEFLTVPIVIPTNGGYRKQFVYLNVRTAKGDCMDSLEKVHFVDTGECSKVMSFGPGVFASPPLFVPKRNAQTEDDGYVLTQLYRSRQHRSAICILNAQDHEKSDLSCVSNCIFSINFMVVGIPKIF